MKKIVLLFMFLIGFAFGADFKLKNSVSYSSIEPMELFMASTDNAICEIGGKNFIPSILNSWENNDNKINGVISGMESNKLKFSWGDNPDNNIFAKFEVGWLGIQEV